MARKSDTSVVELGAPESGVMMVCPTCNGTYPARVEVCPVDGAGLLEVPDTPLLTGLNLDGRYEMGGVIGSGGMGTVYRAFQPSMEREVAIKVLHPKYAHEPRAVKRFFREAQSSSRLIHPHIVTVYDFGRSRGGHLYMVMELVEGWTLGDLIYYHAPLSPALTIGIATQICEALEEAHRRRTVHRDLKPDNVQLTEVEGGAFVKVLDFGIARVLRDPDAGVNANLSTVDISGTPAYMAPEQILGKDPDPRSDLYSLGVMLFEMLAGERPFADDNSMGLCMKQLNDKPPRLGAYLDPEEVPEALEEIVMALMAKEPAERIASAEELKERLLACPEAREVSRSKLGLGPMQLPIGISNAPTRPDAGAMMALPTLGSATDSGDLASAVASARLGDVLERVKLDIPGVERGRDKTPAPGLGLQAPGQLLQVHERPALRGAADALVYMSGHSRHALGRPPIGEWLDARETEGWGITEQPHGVILRVALDGRDKSGPSTLREVIDSLLQLERLALDHNVGLRVGALAVDGDEAKALDLARRLAAVAPTGAVAVPSQLVRALGLRGRPLTGVFLPNGELLDCSAVAVPGVVTTPGVGRRLRGRSTPLRQLSQIAEAARSSGPQKVRITGARGCGRSAVAHAFVHDKPHVMLRVSPAARVWPGHTAARLVRACLALADDAPERQVLAALDGFPHRDRDLLALLLLDREPDEPATQAELARAVLDALERRAGGADSPFVIALDDAHLVDAASAELLESVVQQARSQGSARPWVFVATSNGAKKAELFADKGVEVVELRPLGIRAAGSLLESLEVPVRRRSALAQAAHGNPLALVLLATLPSEAALPPSDKIVTSLLPETLRQLGSKEAEQVWLKAVVGADEDDSRAVQAARLYIEVGLPKQMQRWLVERLEAVGGSHARLARAWAAPTRQGWLDRASRHERLGLWRLAELDFEAAIGLAGGGAAWERLQAARMRALDADVTGALKLYQTAVQGGQAVSAEALLRLAAALLEGGELTHASKVLSHARSLCAKHDIAVAGEIAALVASCAVREGESAEALAQLGLAREAADALRTSDARRARALEAQSQKVRAEIALAQGEVEQARLNLSQARDAFRDLGRASQAVSCLVQLGRLELDAGAERRAADTFRAALSMARGVGLRAAESRARAGLGEALVRSGELDEGTRLLRKSLRATEDERVVVDAALGMARAMLLRGLMVDAARYAERALATASGAEQRARGLLMLSEIRAQSGHLRKAARGFAEVVELATRAGQGLVGRIARARLEGLSSGRSRAPEAAGSAR